MEPLLRMLPARPQPLAVRYGVTSVLVGLCFLTLMGLQGRSGLLAFYLLFPAIFAASVPFDRGSGAGLSAHEAPRQLPVAWRRGYLARGVHSRGARCRDR